MDKKHRLTIPSAWRGVVGDPKGLCIMPDLDKRCLRVFQQSEMDRAARNSKLHDRTDPKVRDILRELGRQTQDVEWDAQGRFRIRDDLVAFAKFKEEVVMIGTSDSFELWADEVLGDVSRVDQRRLREAVEFMGLFKPEPPAAPSGAPAAPPAAPPSPGGG